MLTQTLAEAVSDLLAGADPRWRRDPYPLYDRLREEAPVFRFGPQLVLLTRYADVKAARLDPTVISPRHSVARQEGALALLSDSDLADYREILDFNGLMLTHHDGAFHRDYRAALQRAFIPKQVAEWPQQVQEIVDRELAAVAGDGVVDLMSFAYRVPLLVIMELLGAPAEDAERVKHWGDAVIESLAVLPLDPALVRSGAERLREYTAYAQEMIADLKEHDGPRRTSVIALLLAAEESERLSTEQIVATFMHFLFAGHETTTNMIASGMLWLLANREQWELLCQDPARRGPDAVEESLRYEAPSQIKLRETTAPVVLGGELIEAGVSVQLFNAAANRDPEVFENPHRFDITRGRSDHMALGLGRHFCLGAPLARLEGQIAFETLARRYPDMQLAAEPDQLEWRPQPRLRGLVSLPVRLGRPRA